MTAPLSKGTLVRPTADAMSRMPELARITSGEVEADFGDGAVSVIWDGGHLIGWMKASDVEVIDDD